MDGVELIGPEEGHLAEVVVFFDWPDGTLADNDLLTGLLTDGFDADTPLFGPDDKLDDHLDPAQIIQVVDADASQTKVIEVAVEPGFVTT